MPSPYNENTTEQPNSVEQPTADHHHHHHPPLLGIDKLHARLEACGVDGYFFVNDRDTTDRYVAAGRPDGTDGDSRVELRPCRDQTHDVTAVHVKTLVWKGIYLPSTTTTSSGAEDGSSKPPARDATFYFATALRVQDKVELKALRAIVRSEFPRRRDDGGALIVRMADRKVAEDITGFVSGSIPPGWHTRPIKLFIDDYIIEDAAMTTLRQGSEAFNNALMHTTTENDADSDADAHDAHAHGGDNTTPQNYTDRYRQVMLSVGSGTTGYSLHVPLQSLIQSSLYSNTRTDEPDAVHNDRRARSLRSFTRARADATGRQNQIKNSVDRSDGPRRTIPTGQGSDGSRRITRRRFQLTARKKGAVADVRRMIEEMGDVFPSFMMVEGTEDGGGFSTALNKNALHYAAWKGDLETTALLIHACARFDATRDIVNVISTGEGNYGKTPIFYSVTQYRDDAVLLLLSHGANLLIVNNKGQTPCSLAVNHLKIETRQAMFRTEEAQLKAGGKFVNYRSTHSDNRSYGDLDPRFLQVDDINMNDDVLAELNENGRPRSSTAVDLEVEGEEEDMVKDGLVDLALPRSVRVTTPIWREETWKRRLELEQQGMKVSTLNTERQASRDEAAATVNTSNNNKDVFRGRINDEKKKETRISYPPGIVIANDGEVIDIEKLDNLRISDILSFKSDADRYNYDLVDDDIGIQALDNAIDEVVANLEAHLPSHKPYDETDETIIKNSWGLDCEWRPSHLPNEDNPITTLQLSCLTRAFVVDVQTLCQTNIRNTSAHLTDTEHALSHTLTKLFADRRIRVLGFGVAQDITKLAASFPHLPCFREVHAVVDLQALSRSVYPDTSKRCRMGSLQKTVAIFWKKRLDKGEQCSEWDVRPLTGSQLEYAALDAAVLPTLLRMMMEGNPTVEEDDGVFLMKKSFLQQSFRFTFLDDDAAYRTPMGGVKISVGVRVARQIWGTFNAAPVLPTVMPPHERQKSPISKSKQKPKEPKGSRGARRIAIDLNVLAGDLLNLPTAGQVLDYTKESCIERVVQKQAFDSLPEDTYLRYNRRSGVIGIENAWLLFVNFGVGKVYHKYRNKFLLGGRQVTFTVNPARYEDCDLLQALLASTHEDAEEFWRSTYQKKPALLFIRGSTKEKYTFCGECEYSAHTEHDDLVDLILQLKDFEELSERGTDRESSTYMDIVASQAEDDAVEL